MLIQKLEQLDMELREAGLLLGCHIDGGIGIHNLSVTVEPEQAMHLATDVSFHGTSLLQKGYKIERRLERSVRLLGHTHKVLLNTSTRTIGTNVNKLLDGLLKDLPTRLQLTAHKKLEKALDSYPLYYVSNRHEILRALAARLQKLKTA